MNDIKTTHNPYYLEKLEDIAKKNGGHFVNNQVSWLHDLKKSFVYFLIYMMTIINFLNLPFQLTWADIYFSALSDLLSNVAGENILAKYPTLNALKEKTDALPGIKAHRDKRPKTI